MLFGTAVDQSGEAADTGSAVHVALASWHGIKDLAKSIREMERRGDEYPLADFPKAREYLERYAQDPRNLEADVIATEQKVTFTLSPASDDPTKEEIFVAGTLDQIRRNADGRAYVWDFKATTRSIGDLLADYTIQLCAYVVGASQWLGEQVYPGGFIRLGGYVSPVANKKILSPDGVFVALNLSPEQCVQALDEVRSKVSRIRRGDVTALPGSACHWCPLQSFAMCSPLLTAFQKDIESNGQSEKVSSRRRSRKRVPVDGGSGS